MIQELYIKFMVFVATSFLLSKSLTHFKIDLLSSLFFLVFILTILQYMAKPVLIFLTLPNKKSLIFIFNLILFFGTIYFFKLFIPGIYIDESEFLSINLDFISISKIEMNSFFTMFFVALVFVLMNYLTDLALNKK